MKRFVFLISAAMSVTALFSNPSALQVKELTLKNGMTVWLNEDHSQPKVFGAVVVRAGAKDCPDTGIAHYFEHIMFKGTDRLGTVDYEAERPWLDSIAAQYDLLAQTHDELQRTAIQHHINELSLRAADYAIPNEFNRLISRYGGSGLNAATGPDATFYFNTFLPQYIVQWCHLNAHRLCHPVFRGFQGELENVYEEKNRSSDNLGDVLDKALKAVFKDQPYAYPVIGSTEHLKNPRLSDMEAFYKQYYVASNMGLILCGDITIDDTLTALLEQTFGQVQTGPVPERKRSPMPAIEKGERTEIKLPIPIIGAEALVFNGPTAFDADANAMHIARQLLSNEKAGMLDSLMNEHAVMASGIENIAFDDAAVEALYIIPKIPFGKMKKAEALCMAQLQRLMQGDFSEEQLEIQKQLSTIEAELAIENVASRAELMIDVFSKGYTWQQYLDQIESRKQVTKADVMRVARKYYDANHITLAKKFGMPNKETLSQPGYKPITPKNADAKSAFARELEQLPVKEQAIRLIDFERDAQCVKLNDHVTLYAKENPLNDIFTFRLRYLDGTRHTPLLDLVCDYLEAIGTDSLKKQQLETAWQRIGVTLEIIRGDNATTFALTGRDHQLQPALQLLAHFLSSAKGDKEALKDIKQGLRVDDKSFGRQKDDVLKPMLQWIAYGDASDFLTKVSYKESKKISDDQLLQAFNDLQHYDCQLFYCGRLPIDHVATVSQQTLPLSLCSKPKADTYRKAIVRKEPTMYFYHVPKSRQNYIVSYETLAPATSDSERATAELWASYMGSGMSSVLFQNIREYQSLAYSTSGAIRMPNAVRHPTDSLVFLTVTGTQADKSIQAMSAVDSLMRHMPMKQENIEAARQELLSDIQNSYPSFRHIAIAIANARLEGYENDPDTYKAQLLPTLSAAAVEGYSSRQVAPNQRVWIVIGDRKKTDMKALERYGQVVELRKADIFK